MAPLNLVPFHCHGGYAFEQQLEVALHSFRPDTEAIHMAEALFVWANIFRSCFAALVLIAIWVLGLAFAGEV